MTKEDFEALNLSVGDRVAIVWWGGNRGEYTVRALGGQLVFCYQWPQGDESFSGTYRDVRSIQKVE